MNTIADPITFIKEMNVTLQLEVEGKKGEIFSGHIEEIQLDLHSYGYDASVRFNTFDEDETNQLFAEDKVMKATLVFKSTDPKKAGIPLLEIKGIVADRSYISLGTQAQNKSVRIYKIHFSDFAKMSWGHHFPIKIYVDQTMKEVIDAEKNPLVSLKYDLDVLNEASPIIALPMNRPGQDKVSFYSFLMWYLHKSNGIFEYNYKEHSYSILGKKSEAGAPIILPEWEISPAICQYPEPSRSHGRMIKHSPENEDHTDEDNPNAHQAVRNDLFDESGYLHFPEQIFPAINSKLCREKPTIKFHLIDFSETFGLEHLLPGTLFKMQGSEIRGSKWCDDPVYKDKEFRLTGVSFKATNTMSTESSKKPVRNYLLEIQALAESKDETYVTRPVFQEPTYPFSIPGTIFSDVGDKEQTTFNVVKHEKVPLGHYLVKVPLVGDEKKIVVPFFPDFSSGQHYFPLCKDQQVMLAMYFQTAKIERVLDWQPLARLPLDTQANQIVFASNGKDKFFIQKHEFLNGKDSVFVIKQSSSPDQTQTIQIQEKEVLILVEEKGKNGVSIQFHRDSGFTIKVKDEASGVTQQSVYNATSITHTSEGKGGTSTFVQKPDSISMESKKINMKCDEGLIDASKTLTLKAGTSVFLDTPVANTKDKMKIGG